MRECMVHFPFDHGNERTLIRIRSIEHEQIREARRRHALIGLCSIAPSLCETQTLAPNDFDRREIFRRGEARREHEGVELSLFTVRQHDAVCRNPGDILCDQF